MKGSLPCMVGTFQTYQKSFLGTYPCIVGVEGHHRFACQEESRTRSHAMEAVEAWITSVLMASLPADLFAEILLEILSSFSIIFLKVTQSIMMIHRFLDVPRNSIDR